MNPYSDHPAVQVGKTYSSVYRFTVLVGPAVLMAVHLATSLNPNMSLGFFLCVEAAYDLSLTAPLFAPKLARRASRRWDSGAVVVSRAPTLAVLRPLGISAVSFAAILLLTQPDVKAWLLHSQKGWYEWEGLTLLAALLLLGVARVILVNVLVFKRSFTDSKAWGCLYPAAGEYRSDPRLTLVTEDGEAKAQLVARIGARLTLALGTPSREERWTSSREDIAALERLSSGAAP